MKVPLFTKVQTSTALPMKIWMQPVRCAAFPGKYLTVSISSPPGLEILLEKHGINVEGTTVIYLEYERNLASITLAEAMKDAGYKTFFAGKWHLGSPGPQIMGLISIKVAGMWAVHGADFSLLTLIQIWNPVLMGNPSPCASGRKPLTLSKPIRISLSLPIYLFIPYMLPFRRHRHYGKNIAIRQKKWALQNKGTLSFDRRLNVRQVQDCPIYAGMIEQLDQAVGIVLNKLDELGLDIIPSFASPRQWRKCLCHIQPTTTWRKRTTMGRWDS